MRRKANIVCFFVCLVVVAIALGWCYAHENTILMPSSEDNAFEYGIYTTHDNATGENKTGTYIYQKPERREEPDRGYVEEKWDEMMEEYGLDGLEADED